MLNRSKFTFHCFTDIDCGLVLWPQYALMTAVQNVLYKHLHLASKRTYIQVEDKVVNLITFMYPSLVFQRTAIECDSIIDHVSVSLFAIALGDHLD